MIDIPTISGELLDQDLTEEFFLEYLKVLDPKRVESLIPLNMEMLIGLLKACDYLKVADLHNRVKLGWEKFLDYEKKMLHSEYPLSGTMFIYFILLISDEKSRKKICSEEQLKELVEYFQCST